MSKTKINIYMKWVFSVIEEIWIITPLINYSLSEKGRIKSRTVHISPAETTDTSYLGWKFMNTYILIL